MTAASSPDPVAIERPCAAGDGPEVARSRTGMGSTGAESERLERGRHGSRAPSRGLPHTTGSTGGADFTYAHIDYLTSAEVEALLQALDQKTWGGRRDA